MVLGLYGLIFGLIQTFHFKNAAIDSFFMPWNNLFYCTCIENIIKKHAEKKLIKKNKLGDHDEINSDVNII